MRTYPAPTDHLQHSPLRARFRAGALTLGLVLFAGCASTEGGVSAQGEPSFLSRAGQQVRTFSGNALKAAPTYGEIKKAAVDAGKSVREEAPKALAAPLEDLNLKQEKIPPALARITDPFAPAKSGCKGIARELAAIETALGVDKKKSSGAGAAAKVGRMASRATVDLVRGVTQSVVPMRNVVRAVSGADKAQRDLASAKERGVLRVAFLKGQLASKGCPTT